MISKREHLVLFEQRCVLNLHCETIAAPYVRKWKSTMTVGAYNVPTIRSTISCSAVYRTALFFRGIAGQTETLA